MAVLFLGRFQPFHNGHVHILESIQDEDVIIAIGSAYESHTAANPFTAAERAEMVLLSGFRPLALVPVPDINRYSLWVRHVESLVPPFEEIVTNNPRDRTLFSDAGYPVKEVPLRDRQSLNGTAIRERIAKGAEWRHLVPEGTVEVIERIGGVDRIRAISSGDI